ncbi:Uncharacterised protein [Mycobacteroides abscessus subsp. abscessus]|nr:Uncharacterised protein [Mycobacteroides abscessus subsp. abscessus]
MGSRLQTASPMTSSPSGNPSISSYRRHTASRYQKLWTAPTGSAVRNVSTTAWGTNCSARVIISANVVGGSSRLNWPRVIMTVSFSQRAIAPPKGRPGAALRKVSLSRSVSSETCSNWLAYVTGDATRVSAGRAKPSRSRNVCVRGVRPVASTTRSQMSVVTRPVERRATRTPVMRCSAVMGSMTSCPSRNLTFPNR